MSILTIALGLILFTLGLGGYALTGFAHPTALIPSAFGLAFLGMGLAARKDSIRMHVMHLCALLALIGTVATLGGLARLPALLSGAPVERPAAVVSKAAMSLACGVYLVLCVKSFMDARLRRRAPPPAT